ncbi:alkene reductase, partial [Rhizobium ruizarguesonis]
RREEAKKRAKKGKGEKETPGIDKEAQVDGGRKVTDAVHAKGSRIVLQLWHVGRVSHVDLQPGGRHPVAPSAIRAET